MKLNLDCVRDILLVVEDKPSVIVYTLDEIAEKINYSKKDIEYCCYQLSMGGYLEIDQTPTPFTSSMPLINGIGGLTFQGHEFLNYIKSNTIWNKTKAKAKELGIYSLKWMGEFAQQLAIAMIAGQIHN